MLNWSSVFPLLVSLLRVHVSKLVERNLIVTYVDIDSIYIYIHTYMKHLNYGAQLMDIQYVS